jgi:Ca-activated chloride channel family protein
MLAVACLDLVKATAGRFIERRQGGPLGLILFGSRAYLKTPLSYDCDSVRTLRDESFSAPRGGA